MNKIHRCKTRELQALIANEFPAYAYHGKVMATSHDPSEYEVETDNLDVVLAGRTWKEIDAQFVTTNRDGNLGTDGTFPAFSKDKLTLSIIPVRACRAAPLSRGERPIRRLLQSLDKIFRAQRPPSVRILPQRRDLRFALSGRKVFPPAGNTPSLFPFLHRRVVPISMSFSNHDEGAPGPSFLEPGIAIRWKL